MTRKIFYSIDVLLCCIFLVFTFHHRFYYILPWLNVTVPGLIFAVYPIWLRMILSFLLYRKERKSFIPIILFSAIFVFIFYNTFNNHLGWRYCMNWLHDIYDETFYVPMNERVYAQWSSFRWENPAVIFFNLWTLLVPVISYIVLYVRKRLTGNVATWHNLLGTYIFYDNAGKKFLPMLAIVFTSYLLGVATDVTLSSFGVVILPVLAFIVIARCVEYKPKFWEYILLVTSLYCFNDSQFFFDTPRVVMLVASALGIMVVAIRLGRATKRWFVSAFAYMLIAFILPVLTIGYNIYAGTDCGRMRNYTDYYITSGVIYVHHDNEIGIRSRYRVIMPPKYKRIEPVVVPTIYRWKVDEAGDSARVPVHTARQSEVLAITENNDSVMYSPHGDYYVDVSTREWRFPTAEDLKR